MQSQRAMVMADSGITESDQPSGLEPNSRDPIDVISESFLERLRRGEHPSISEYVSKYPELADEIKDFFPTLAMLENFGPGEQNDSQFDSVQHTIAIPQQLGEYRIVREIGRGGMGVVYEAEHDLMRRRVALKVLPKQMSVNSSGLRRFHREARAAGGLHHTNIVPVFEVGMDEGFHFYAMQYIDGQSLDLVFNELRNLQPSGWQSGPKVTAETPSGETPSANRSSSASLAMSLLSGRFSSRLDKQLSHDELPGDESGESPNDQPDDRGLQEPVAADSMRNSRRQNEQLESSSTSVITGGLSDLTNASTGRSQNDYFRRVTRVGLDVADALSFAHEQGILHRDIKPSNLILDMAGVTWVTDFGLAKSKGDDDTHTGDLVGTLRYMAPERLNGQADARSDIYGLGLTLYELCTLRPAFEASNRTQLLNRIVQYEPPAPRKINREIPRDLETIILKAIAKAPENRYQSAWQLADDLHLFLDDRPIRARRASRTERLWRMCRRNPVSALLVSCVVVLMFVIVAGSVRFGYEMESRSSRATAAEREARNAQAEAIERLYELYVGRAESGRRSDRMGRNFASVESITLAAAMLPDLDMSDEKRRTEQLKLRNEAIAAMSLVDVRTNHEWLLKAGWHSDVAFDADYEYFAQNDDRGNIAVRRVGEAEPEILLESIGERAWAMKFSNDRAHLSSKYHDPNKPLSPVFVVWNLKTGFPILRLEDNIQNVASRFSPNNREIAISRRNGKIDIYSLQDGSITKSIDTGFDPIDFTFDANGDRLAVARNSKSVIQIWQLNPKPTLLDELKLGSPAFVLDWNSQRSILATGTMTGELFVWHDEQMQLPPWQFEPHQGRVVRLAIHPEGNYVISSGWDDKTRINDLATRRQVVQIDGDLLAQSGFSRDGQQIAYRRSNGSFGVWEFPNPKVFTVLSSNITDGRLSTSFHPTHDRLLVSSAAKTIEFWDVRERRIVAALQARQGVRCRFTPDGSALMTSDSTGIQRWPIDIEETSAGRLKVVIDSPERIYHGRTERMSIDASRQYLVAVTAKDKTAIVDLRNANSSNTTRRISGLDQVAISPRADWFVTSTWQGSGLGVWDTRSGEQIKNLADHWGSASIAISPDGMYLVGSSRTQRGVWETKTWSPIRLDDRHESENWPGPVTFPTHSRFIAAAKSRYIPQLEETKTGRILAVLESPKAESMKFFSFSSDDRYLAISNLFNIHVWNLALVKTELEKMGLDWSVR